MAAAQGQAPQFVVTKWNAVALWSWEMEQDTCAICKYGFVFNSRSSLVEKCVECSASGGDESSQCPPEFVCSCF
jgi:RING-box protein 1